MSEREFQLAVKEMVGPPESATDLLRFHAAGGNPSLRTVAIVGFAETTRHLAPFADEQVEIWGMNHLYPYIPRWDRWFELHQLDMLKTLPFWMKAEGGAESYQDFLERLHTKNADGFQDAKPIYMQQGWPQFPSAVAYPLAQAQRVFGGYWTNTVSYMVALALLEGRRRIEIYGVDMRDDEEYSWQRPNCEFLLGWAKALGVEVVLPAASALLTQRWLYGYEEPSDNPFLEMENALLEQKAQLKKDFEAAASDQNAVVNRMQSIDGAIQMTDHLLKRIRYKDRGGVL